MKLNFSNMQKNEKTIFYRQKVFSTLNVNFFLNYDIASLILAFLSSVGFLRQKPNDATMCLLFLANKRHLVTHFTLLS